MPVVARHRRRPVIDEIPLLFFLCASSCTSLVATLGRAPVLRRSDPGPSLERPVKRGHVLEAQKKCHLANGDPLILQVSQGPVAAQIGEDLGERSPPSQTCTISSPAPRCIREA